MLQQSFSPKRRSCFCDPIRDDLPAAKTMAATLESPGATTDITFEGNLYRLAGALQLYGLYSQAKAKSLDDF